MSYLEQHTRSLFGRAVHHYALIRHQDRVAVALSGGKDSLALLWLLVERRRRVPIDYELTALWVDFGWPGFNHQALAGFCAGLDVELVQIEADWDPRGLDSCYLCARRRRQRLFEAAQERSLNVLALGHNLDDLIETFFLNLIFGGRAAAFRPKESFFAGLFTVIRPLILLPEAKLSRFARQKELPVQTGACSRSQTTSRARLKEVLKNIYAQHPRAKENIFRGLSRVDPAALPKGLPG